MRAAGVREKIERAAIELFAANGIDGVSIGEIAGAAGVSQGALYRHYASKEELGWTLFSTAYLRAGAELDSIRAGLTDYRARIAAMVAHFCALYDDDPALFRFMLLAQHGFLPRIGARQRTPVSAVVDAVSDAVAAAEVAPVDPDAAAAAVLGIVLQTAVFHIYGRMRGLLSARAPALTRAALAAVSALAGA